MSPICKVGLTLVKEERRISTTGISFLGHNLDKNEVRPDAEKLSECYPRFLEVHLQECAQMPDGDGETSIQVYA